MSFFLLANIGSTYGKAFLSPYGTGLDSAYTLTTRAELFSGPRSEICQFLSTASTGSGAHVDFLGTSKTATHAVITRMDWALALESTAQYQIYQNNAVGTTSVLVSWANVSALTLMGPRNQDAVIPISPTQTYGLGFGLRKASGATATMRVSDACFCKSFDIGYPTSEAPPSWETIPAGLGETRTLDGYFNYDCERVISLNWTALTDSQITTFKTFLTESDARLQPFFLYDDTAELWIHKLEHVIVESWTIQSTRASDVWALSMTVRRLRHFL